MPELQPQTPTHIPPNLRKKLRFTPLPPFLPPSQDDVSFVDGCSSPTSLQYMRELNPIYLQRPRPVLPLPHQLGPRHCLV